MNPLIILFLFFIGINSYASSNLDETTNKISAILEESEINLKDFSFSFQNVEHQTPLISVNSKQKRHPASLIKIITTLVALELLGPNFKWETIFSTDGQVVNNSLNGNLFVKGGGDPFLTIEDIWKIVYEFRKLDIQHIKGNIFLDNTIFSDMNVSANNFGTRLYEVNPNALMTNFKWMDFLIQINSSGVEISHFPPFKNIHIKNFLKVTNKSCISKNIKLKFEESAVKNNVLISGEIPKSCKKYKLSRSILTPEDYFFSLLQFIWETNNNGRFPTKYSLKKYDPNLKVLIKWQSRPLASIVRSTNKWSNNLMSKTLLYSLGSHQVKKTDSTVVERGLQLVNSFLAKNELASETLRLVDGSGLEREVRASTDDITSVLNFAWKRDIRPEFVSSLSIAGKDGTTRNLFKNLSLGNAARIKTGTLKGVISAGGYVFSKSGNIYSFAAIFNSTNLNKDHARNSLGEIIKTLIEKY